MTSNNDHIHAIDDSMQSAREVHDTRLIDVVFFKKKYLTVLIIKFVYLFIEISQVNIKLLIHQHFNKSKNFKKNKNIRSLF